MKIRFWGVRGSIPTPGPDTVRYGGNTSCIEVRTEGGALIILDAGTGIHPLARQLLWEMPISAGIFITHTHWDHIQGLPFFLPLFVQANHISIHGPFDPITSQGIDQVMNVQMQYSFFPVREAELCARIDYHSLSPGQMVEFGDARVTPVLLNHPVINYGYRIDSGGKSLFFTGDHEPHTNIYKPGEDNFDSFQSLIDEKEASIEAMLSGVDVLIADCAYTESEYAVKKGWGHGNFASALALAQRIGAKTLFCTHHEPGRDDDALEAAFAAALSAAPQKGCDMQLAREGLEYTW
ncbi:MAG: ribonuclease Z [Betaproteobacteria bacterium ADurb.Bin341]|nr:MAG: ribonuclease Z [Betaproteobacteria bacterium ADurb.Bin341]